MPDLSESCKNNHYSTESWRRLPNRFVFSLRASFFTFRLRCLKFCFNVWNWILLNACKSIIIVMNLRLRSLQVIEVIVCIRVIWIRLGLKGVNACSFKSLIYIFSGRRPISYISEDFSKLVISNCTVKCVDVKAISLPNQQNLIIPGGFKLFKKWFVQWLELMSCAVRKTKRVISY